MLRNQSQPAEVALARNCVVSVSHISGVAAAAAAAADVKKREADRNEISSRAAASPTQGEKKTHKKKNVHTNSRVKETP